MNHRTSTATDPLEAAMLPPFESIGPRHLVGLVLCTCLCSTLLQWCWEEMLRSELTFAPTADNLPIDLPITLLALFLVKSALSVWHPVFKLDVPAMWRALVLGSVQP